MRNLLTIKSFLIPVFSLFVIMNNVFARQCYEKSPTLAQLKDNYYNLRTNIKISDKDRALLKNLYNNIKGQWKGAISYTICAGPDNAPEKSFQQLDATMIFHISNNYLEIKSKKLQNDSGLSKEINLRLLAGEGLFHFKFRNKNKLVFTEILHKNNSSGGSHIIENFYQLELDGDTLSFKIVYYANGIFIGNEKWSLVRDNSGL